MEQYFAALTKRQTMLLLTSVTFGGNEVSSAFDMLPDEEAELLRHRAQAMLEIPREKRLPMVVQELKRLVTERRRVLAAAEPRRLATALEGERRTLQEVVLRALPSNLADAVRAELGEKPVKLVREIRPDVLAIVRWKLEEKLNRQPTRAAFAFSDILLIKQRELLSICDRMGARVLATAVAGLSPEAQDRFFSALPPDQRSLALRAADAGRSMKLPPNDAVAVMKMYGALDEPSRGLRSAGMQRIVRACLAEGSDVAERLASRHPGLVADLVVKWHQDEKNKPRKGDGGRGDIVEQLERLAQRGVIDRPMRLLPPPARPKLKPPEAPAKTSKKQSRPLLGGAVMSPKPNPRPQERAAPRGGEKERVGDVMARRAARQAGAMRDTAAIRRHVERPPLDPRIGTVSKDEPSNSQRQSGTATPIVRAKPLQQGLPKLKPALKRSPTLSEANIPRSKKPPGGGGGRKE